MNELTNHRPIEVITGEIKFYSQQAGMSIIEIGKRLHEAKLCLPHGEWGNWLKNEVNFSERAAQNFMRIAREYQNPQMIADMGNSTTKALLLLSLPAVEREDFVAETHIIDGEAKTVAEMTTKEMEELTKQLAAERAEKEKLQSQLALFEDTAQKEKDAAIDVLMKETEDKIEDLVSRKEAAEQAQKAAENRISILEAELDEAKMQAEQTVLVDETELEKVRAEAEAKARTEMESRLEKEKANAEKYRREAAEAEKAIEAHEQAQKEAEEAAVAAREELAKVKAEKTAAPTTEVFKVRLETVIGEVNKMVDCMMDARNEGRTEEAEELRAKMKKLGGFILSCAEEGEAR